jgi:predicted pyridoxine 5'-phosphate oxidase superfamily flavin-nucleotide-binding protein
MKYAEPTLRGTIGSQDEIFGCLERAVPVDLGSGYSDALPQRRRSALSPHCSLSNSKSSLNVLKSVERLQMPHGSRLNGTLRRFIEKQDVFFIATAASSGRVNLSPKGADTLRVLDDRRMRWLNLSGSGNETAGHLRQSNRITLMFCAFEGDALILRVYGSAKIIHPRDREWEHAVSDFPDLAGSRQIFDVSVESVQTSCGTGVPVMKFERHRANSELVPFYEKMGPSGVDAYWRKKNVVTIDGFPTGLFEDDG